METKKELTEMSRNELLAYVLFGGCINEDPGVTDESLVAYTEGYREKKETPK